MSGPKVQDDLDRGDYGRAKERLCSYIRGAGYSPSVCVRIAEICVKMHDPREAGRWYFIGDEDSAEADRHIKLFLGRFGPRPVDVVAQLPKVTKLADRSRYPLCVQRRLDELGLTGQVGESYTRAIRGRESIVDAGVRFGCVAALLMLGLIFVIGCVTIGGWIIGMWH
ncbi:MAG: hypothetical protein H6810_08655 [Phycisphaeraceae bacterium]|nr:MAG: hypothetical protein H6810_08655 [Phycisphaeraceae bacterium]